MRYETDSNSLRIENTENGYLSDIKLEGKTLVNCLRRGAYSYAGSLTSETLKSTIQEVGLKMTSSTKGSKVCYKKAQLKKNTVYTFILQVKLISSSNNIVSLSFKEGSTYVGSQINLTLSNNGEYTYLVKKLSTSNSENLEGCVVGNHSTLVKDDELWIKDFMVLEGDYTQNPPSYFEGLASVGDDVENIEVLSVKSDGNLFDAEGLTWGAYKGNVIGLHYNDTYDKNSTSTTRVIGKPIYIPPNSPIYFKCNGYQIAIGLFDENLRLVGDLGWHTTNTAISLKGNQRYICSYIRKSNDAVISLEDIEFIKNNAIIAVSSDYDSIVYQPYKSDKKILLYKDKDGFWKKPIIRGVNDTIRDTYDSDELKYYKRCEEVVFDSGENWQMGSGAMENTIYFLCQIPTLNRRAGSNNFTNDKLINYAHGDLQTRLDVKGFSMNTHQEYANYVYVRLYKSELETQDVEGFKKWLKSNPITVIYQLAKEEVYECTPISVSSFANETTYQIESGAISPNSTFETDYTLSNAVNRIKDIKVFNRAMTDNLNSNINELLKKINS